MLRSVLLIRHARPVTDPAARRSESALSADGVKAARALGAALVDRVWGCTVACSSER